VKRNVKIPMKPFVTRVGDEPPRERRKLGVKFEAVTGDAVSGLR